MNYYSNLPSNGEGTASGESDWACVAAMAHTAFGPVITENDFIKQHLPDVVAQLVKQSQVTSKFTIKEVHSILAFFGLNTRGLRKHEELRMFMEAAFLLICYRNNVHEETHYNDIDSLKDAYGAEFFKGMEEEEAYKLLKYRNFMQIAVRYINPRQNKDYLLDLVTRLAEGSTVRYVPGSGATLPTRNRIEIFRKEGNVPKTKRPTRHTDTECKPLLKRPWSVDGGGTSPDEDGQKTPRLGCFAEDTAVKPTKQEEGHTSLFNEFSGDGRTVDDLDDLFGGDTGLSAIGFLLGQDWGTDWDEEERGAEDAQGRSHLLPQQRLGEQALL
jgi:hypothetical protein